MSPPKIKYARESSLAKFSIHLHSLPDNICSIRSCSGAQSQVEHIAWVLLCAMVSAKASLLLPSPRFTPPWALWTQQSPAHSLSLGWCRLDLTYPRDLTATTSLWCSSKFALSVQKSKKKTPGFKDKLSQLKIQGQYLNLSFLQAIKHRTSSQGRRMNENRLELKTKYFYSCCLL